MGFLRRFWTVITWSETPDHLSKPLREVPLARGKFLKRIWVADDLPSGADQSTYVGLGDVDISHISDRKTLGVDPRRPFTFKWVTITAGECRKILADAIGAPSLDSVISHNLDGTIYRLDLAITEMRPGSWLARGTFLALFGVGHSWVQVEGVLSENATSLPVFRFAELRRHADILGFSWMRNREGASGPVMVERLLQEIGFAVLREVGRLFPR